VFDPGGAIPGGDLERIFEAFEDVTAPSGRRVGGLGVALALALVRRHGGEVWCESEPQEGARPVVGLALSGPSRPGRGREVVLPSSR